jgi:hypothetical protein
MRTIRQDRPAPPDDGLQREVVVRPFDRSPHPLRPGTIIVLGSQ